MPVDIGAVISRSFQLVFQNRVFWALGLVVALLSGTINFNLGAPLGSRGVVGGTFDSSLAASSLIASCVTFLLLVVFFVLRMAFEAGLISAGDQAARGPAPSFRAA